MPNQGKQIGWTPEEDEKLKQLVQFHGTKRWAEIARKLGTKQSKQCRCVASAWYRRRWQNHLSVDTKTGGWTEEEDRKLMEGYKRFGHSWTRIARMVGQRTDNAVKNRWAVLMRKRTKPGDEKEHSGDESDESEDISEQREATTSAGYFAQANQDSSSSPDHQQQHYERYPKKPQLTVNIPHDKASDPPQQPPPMSATQTFQGNLQQADVSSAWNFLRSLFSMSPTAPQLFNSGSVGFNPHSGAAPADAFNSGQVNPAATSPNSVMQEEANASRYVYPSPQQNWGGQVPTGEAMYESPTGWGDRNSFRFGGMVPSFLSPTSGGTPFSFRHFFSSGSADANANAPASTNPPRLRSQDSGGSGGYGAFLEKLDFLKRNMSAWWSQIASPTSRSSPRYNSGDMYPPAFSEKELSSLAGALSDGNSDAMRYGDQLHPQIHVGTE